MDILIFPGFSPKNKIWAEQIKSDISDLGNVTVIEWEHWNTGTATDNFIEEEANRIVDHISTPVNIIAKSIGTLIAMKVVEKISEKIEKLILCGIPIKDFDPGDENSYISLNKIKAENVICFQNENDYHGTFEEVHALVSGIDQNVKITSKSRSDHEYPYADDFKKFLI